MDWNIIIPSLITGLVAFVGSVLGFVSTMSSQRRKSDEAQQSQFEDLRKTTQKSIVDLESSMHSVLTNHRNEYLAGVQEVKDATTDLKASYQTSIATISMQIESLEKKQDKHNSVIERTYELEKKVAVLENKNAVSEHRLNDLENDGK